MASARGSGCPSTPPVSPAVARINGALNNDLQQNWRVGATLAIPVNRLNSIKFSASSGVSARTGNDYDAIAIAWQYRWGGQL